MTPRCEKITRKINKLEAGKFDLSPGKDREFCFTPIVDTLLQPSLVDRNICPSLQCSMTTLLNKDGFSISRALSL